MNNTARRIITFLALTFLIGIGLGVIYDAIAEHLVPSNVQYTNDGLCDICNRPAQYELHDKSGDVIGEFDFYHAVLYDVVKNGSDAIINAPFEITFFANWIYFIPAGILAILIMRLFPNFSFWKRKQ